MDSFIITVTPHDTVITASIYLGDTVSDVETEEVFPRVVYGDTSFFTPEYHDTVEHTTDPQRFVDIMRATLVSGVIARTNMEPLTSRTDGYDQVFECMDSTPGIDLK